MQISTRIPYMIAMKSASVCDGEEYHRIATAIAFMRQHHLNQPDLAAVAQYIGLSEYHFQRMFTAWAGISPKRFLQYLTVEYPRNASSYLVQYKENHLLARLFVSPASSPPLSLNQKALP
jgi:AraC family transcriptional regulator, regulatory protein of adaptative response / methylated-DNA-[protein]-cysteine methyltransferase